MYHRLNSNVTNLKLSIFGTDPKASQVDMKSKSYLVSSVVCYFNDVKTPESDNVGD